MIILTTQKQTKRSKEAEECFEIFCHGRVQTHLYLKELLFIANEKNDQLNSKEHKEKYKNCNEIKLDEIIDNLPNDQPISPLVKEIKEEFEEERNNILRKTNSNKLYDEIMGNNNVTKMKDYLSSLQNLKNIEIFIESHLYDNHIYDRRNKKK